MGYQIIEQPNGKFAVYSSFSNTFVACDMTPTEIKDYFAEKARRESNEQVQRILDLIAAKKEPYYQWTLTFNEAVAEHVKNAENSDAEFTELIVKIARTKK